MMVVTSSILPHITSGAVRALVTTERQRLAILPGVPTTTDVGLSTVSGAVWWGLFGPKGLRPELVDAYVKAAKDVDGNQAFRAQLIKLGITPAHISGDEFVRFIAGESGKWRELIKRAAIKAE
jgi:tripartite-type tricarboxylate transporter receptor subunit TctC